MKNSSWILTLQCPDRVGLVHRATGIISDSQGTVTELRQFNNTDNSKFFMRIEFTTPATEKDLRAQFDKLAKDIDAQWALYPADTKVKTLVMVSKDAHCLNDLLFRHRSGQLPLEIPAIASNHNDLEPLAKFYGIPFYHIPITAETKAEAEKTLRDLVSQHNVELVVLARYMQILSEELCEDMQGNIINIHHSFLPSFKGARPYKQAYDRGVKMIGATAHYVTSDLDEGPIIAQDAQSVDHNASVERLMELGRDTEALTLSRAVKLHAERRILLDGHRTIVFG
ncbi:MAG: formyltetrahydrofolate deformylase [Micrococcaceae bacterium]